MLHDPLDPPAYLPRAPALADGGLPAPRTAISVDRRVFLFLQGPHGPFFARLGGILRAAGATVWRVGFNAGDEFFWRDPAHYIAHRGGVSDWPDHLDRIVREKGVTDLVIYGDVRGVHAAAGEAARRRGLTLHVFEEGYLRPYWITYERDGANGNSALMQVSLPAMGRALRDTGEDMARPPARWGDMRQHKFYGALYHFLVLAANHRYPAYTSHRDLPVKTEFRLNLQRLLMTPLRAVQGVAQMRHIRTSGHSFVLVLLQLEHDSSFRAHSPYRRMSQFVDRVLDDFAAAAPPHHHIVFKAHPLDDGRGSVAQAIRARAQALGIADRVHLVHSGKLAALLNAARSVVTVNSTGAQQALWRGLPVKAMGRAVYSKPGLASEQSLADFLRAPLAPQRALYRAYRDYLLATSQVPGGFYAADNRAHALRQVVDMMLSPDSPYEALDRGPAAFRQQVAAND